MYVTKNMLSIKDQEDRGVGHFILNMKSGEVFVYSKIFDKCKNKVKFEDEKLKDFFTEGRKSGFYVSMKDALSYLLTSYEGGKAHQFLDHQITKYYLSYPDVWFMATEDEKDEKEYLYDKQQGINLTILRSTQRNKDTSKKPCNFIIFNK